MLASGQWIVGTLLVLRTDTYEVTSQENAGAIKAEQDRKAHLAIVDHSVIGSEKRVATGHCNQRCNVETNYKATVTIGLEFSCSIYSRLLTTDHRWLNTMALKTQAMPRELCVIMSPHSVGVAAGSKHHSKT